MVASKVRRCFALCLLFVTLGLQACASTVRSATWADSLHEHADLYSRAAGLTPLTGDGQPEIRVWFDNVMVGEITGRVITAEQVTEYALNWRIDDASRMLVTRRANGRHLSDSAPSALTEVLSELRVLDGENWGCGSDGVGVLLDGVIDGDRFTLSVSNPDFCDDDRSRLVLRSLSSLDLGGPSMPFFVRRNERVEWRSR
jgi:hypothetical protein